MADPQQRVTMKRDRAQSSCTAVVHEEPQSIYNVMEVSLDRITIVERPTDGEAKLFYNPRNPSQFLESKLANLVYTIRVDELQQPLLARAITHDGTRTGRIQRLDLIAGERRYRSLDLIVRNDLPCFSETAPKPEVFARDSVVVAKGRFGVVVKQHGKGVFVRFDDHIGGEAQCVPWADVFPTVAGAKKYRTVPVKVYYNITDERCASLAWTENDNSEPLPIGDEIMFVEQCSRKGLTQKEIVALLRSNVTFVSQTLSFRESLPSAAFAKLVKGEMVRHVAVGFLSYPAELRQRLFERMQAIEEETSAQKIDKLSDEKERYEDAAELQRLEAERATSPAEATRLHRRAEIAERKAARVGEQLGRAISEKGQLTQGHQHRAAAELGANPKRQKALSRDEIEARYVRDMAKYAAGGHVDPVTGNEIPPEQAAIIRRTAKAILDGVYDPIQIIRDYNIDNEHWETPERESELEASPQLQSA